MPRIIDTSNLDLNKFVNCLKQSIACKEQLIKDAYAHGYDAVAIQHEKAHLKILKEDLVYYEALLAKEEK